MQHAPVRLRISDGDGGLVRECLEQIRIVAEVGASGALGAANDQSEELPLLQKRCDHLSMEVVHLGQGP
mgnify:CR=1 FL=1